MSLINSRVKKLCQSASYAVRAPGRNLLHRLLGSHGMVIGWLQPQALAEKKRTARRPIL